MPIANQIDSATFAGQLIGGTTLEEANLQLGRIINYLVGSADKQGLYNRTLGGMHYEPTTDNIGEDKELGKGIIPDLHRILGLPPHRSQLEKYPLDPDAAKLVLRLAELARDEAVKGREEAERLEHEQAKIAKIKQSAKVVTSLLQSALRVVLA